MIDCLQIEADKLFSDCLVSNKAYAVDSGNVTSGLDGTTATIKLVNKMSEMFVFVDLKLDKLGYENQFKIDENDKLNSNTERRKYKVQNDT